jgi:DnaJ-class molecular chaperone
MLTVPKGANTGTVLRLKGKGVARPQGGYGDQYVTLKVVLPDKPDAELEEFITRWSKAQAYDPRRAMEV